MRNGILHPVRIHVYCLAKGSPGWIDMVVVVVVVVVSWGGSAVGSVGKQPINLLSPHRTDTS